MLGAGGNSKERKFLRRSILDAETAEMKLAEMADHSKAAAHGGDEHCSACHESSPIMGGGEGKTNWVWVGMLVLIVILLAYLIFKSDDIMGAVGKGGLPAGCVKTDNGIHCHWG